MSHSIETTKYTLDTHRTFGKFHARMNVLLQYCNIATTYLALLQYCNTSRAVPASRGHLRRDEMR